MYINIHFLVQQFWKAGLLTWQHPIVDLKTAWETFFNTSHSYFTSYTFRYWPFHISFPQHSLSPKPPSHISPPTHTYTQTCCLSRVLSRSLAISCTCFSSLWARSSKACKEHSLAPPTHSGNAPYEGEGLTCHAAVIGMSWSQHLWSPHCVHTEPSAWGGVRERVKGSLNIL